MADNFNFSGFPENNEFEIPDKKPVSHRSSRIPKALEINFGEVTEEEKELMAKFIGINVNDINIENIENVLSKLQAKLSKTSEEEVDALIQSLIDTSSGGSIADNRENTTDDDLFLQTENPMFLENMELGWVQCLKTKDLYDEFIAKYGTDSTKYLDPINGIEDYYIDNVTENIDFSRIESLKFIESNEYAILFYFEPKNKNEYGFFGAVIKTENGFAVYIPVYGNTFKVESLDDVGEAFEVSYYNIDEDSHLFTKEENVGEDFLSFKLFSIEIIRTAIIFALTPIQKSLLITPKEFGEIRNVRASAFKDSNFLQIGKIKSNGSRKANLLLKDAEMPLDEEYDLFIKFNNIYPPITLMGLAKIFSNMDLNDSILLKNCELKYTSDKKLYIEITHF